MFNRAAILMALADGPPVEFRTTASSAAGTSVTKPSGLEVGDLVIVMALNVDATTPALSTSGGSAWTLVDNTANISIFAGKMAIFAKVMDATDVANAWTLGTSADEGALAIRYAGHGATTVTKKTKDAAGSSADFDVTASGFVKAAGHYGAITFAISTDDAANLGPPTGFEERADAAFNSTTRLAFADRLYGYVDSASVTWTDFNTTGLSQTGRVVVLEITGP